MKDETRQLLMKCGVPNNLKGYRYIAEAAEAIIEEPKLADAFVTKLYPLIAEKYGTTGARVERDIRTAIGVSINRINATMYDMMYGSSIDGLKGKPTNKHFILAFVEVLRTYGKDN